MATPNVNTASIPTPNIANPATLEAAIGPNGIVPLANGGTGDGSTFTWVGGTTKQLTVNNLVPDVTTGLVIGSFNISGSGNTSAVTIGTGDVGGVGNSGSVTISTGQTHNGTCGSLSFITGNGGNPSGISGLIQFTTGNSPSTSVTGGIAFTIGNPTNGNAGTFSIQGGQPTGSGNGSPITITSGGSSTGGAGDIAITGGTSNGGPGGTSNIGSVTLKVGFSGTKTGLLNLQNSFGNAVVQVTDDGSNNKGELAFYGATPLNQQTTAVASAAFVVGSGTAVNTASTFDGYTIAQIVKAVRSLGLLA